MFNEFFIKYGHIFFYVCVIIVLCIITINYCGCSSPTESDLSYTTIQYHQSEIVAGKLIYYVTHSGEHAFIDNQPPGTNYAIGKWIEHGQDFNYEGKKWHCKTVKRNYIEIAVY